MIRALTRAVWTFGIAVAFAPASAAGAREAGVCTEAAATIPGALQAAEASLRELAWDAMADFLEQAPMGAEPEAAEDPATSTGARSLVDQAARLQGPARRDLLALAALGAVDRLGVDGPRLRARALARLGVDRIADLLQADDPTLRAAVWLWLAESRAGRCLLPKIDPALVARALADRSRVVEDGDDLVFRSVGHYALLAALRRAGDDAAIDARLRELAAADHPLRPMILGAWIRRAPAVDAGDLAGWLAEPDPAVRLAVALAALERDPGRAAAVLDHAGRDPSDRVTQTIVDAVLDAAAERPGEGLDGITSSARLLAAHERWRGEGSQRAPLPPPRP
ncbi:MAG: hypothetical protein R3B09_21510 [Nannocystaceae bacterium]